MGMRVDGKVAIVTGGASGIGQASALRLAQEGADVVIVDVNLERATQVANEIKALGRKAMALKVDVTKSEDTNRMAKATLDEYGKIDILVNSAGGTAGGKTTSLFHESNEQTWDWVIGLNLKGTLLCTRAVINHMIERRSGRIVNIASVAGIIGSMTRADYSAAKGGVIAFTKTVAKEVAPYGVYINCVSPGPIETLGSPKTPKLAGSAKLTLHIGRFGRPEEVASMVVFLASDEASFIIGQNIPVCGGRTLGEIAKEW